MGLHPLTAREFGITTPEQVGARWSWFGSELNALIDGGQRPGQWHQQRLTGLRTVHQLFIDLSPAAAMDPFATWHLMSRTLRELAAHSEGGYMVGIADAALLLLDAKTKEPGDYWD